MPGRIPWTGSPPRTRGKVALPAWRVCRPGITPAHAGKRSDYAAAAALLEDHPRARGEKAAPASPEASCKGSPPRTRGKDGSTILKNGLPRITPAHAGKRSGSHLQTSTIRDHPRARGEKTRQDPITQAFAIRAALDFIQFLINLIGGQAVGQRTVLLWYADAEIRRNRGQLVIPHILQITARKAQRVHISVARKGR